MKAFLLSFFLLQYSVLSFAFSWTQKTSFNGGIRYGAYSFSINDLGYVGSGVTQSGTNIMLVNDLWSYDPVTDSWTQKASLPSSGLVAAATFTCSGKAYLTTGSDLQSYHNETWEYDPAANSWTSKAAFPGVQRYTCASFSIGDYGFVGMGYNGSALLDFYRYNALTDTWNPIAAIPGAPRQSAKGFNTDVYGYVLGGANGPTLLDSKQLWRYDPIGNSWLQMSNYPGQSSHGFAGFVLNNKIFAGTGAQLNSSSNVNDEFYYYDPTLDSWFAVPDFPGGVRQGTSSMAIGSKGYVGTGSSVIFPSLNYYNDWWVFEDPTGIEEAESDIVVNAYFTDNGTLHVNFDKPLKENVSLCINDISGKELKSFSVKNMQTHADVSLPDISEGIYFFRIIESGKVLHMDKVAYIR